MIIKDRKDDTTFIQTIPNHDQDEAQTATTQRCDRYGHLLSERELSSNESLDWYHPCHEEDPDAWDPDSDSVAWQ